jgi:hypothetical protein
MREATSPRFNMFCSKAAGVRRNRYASKRPDRQGQGAEVGDEYSEVGGRNQGSAAPEKIQRCKYSCFQRSDVGVQCAL